MLKGISEGEKALGCGEDACIDLIFLLIDIF